MHSSIEYVRGLPKDIDDMLNWGHAKDDDIANGIVCDYKKFSLILKNNEGEAFGALVAYAEIYVDDIWITPSYRKQG